jgi:hypothetical protein
MRRGSEELQRVQWRVIMSMILIVLVAFIPAAIAAHVIFRGISEKMTSLAPSRIDWEMHVRGKILPIEITFTLGMLFFALSVIAMFYVSLAISRRLKSPTRMHAKILVTPQQKAASAIINCTDLYSSGNTARKFLILTAYSLGVVSSVLFINYLYNGLSENFFMEWSYWFMPSVFGIPLVLAVRSICSRVQDILDRMRMTDMDLHRFLAVRLLCFFRSLMGFVFIASVILLLMPIVGAMWTRTVEKQTLSSLHSLVVDAPDDFKKLSRDELEEKWRGLSREWDKSSLGIEHWKGIWPFGFRVISGASICICAVMLISGIMIPSANSGRKNSVFYIAFEFSLAGFVSVAATVVCGLMPTMTASEVFFYSRDY